MQRSPLALPLLFFICGIGVSLIFTVFLLLFLFLFYIALWHSQKLNINSVFGANFLKSTLLAFLFFLLGYGIKEVNESNDFVLKDPIELPSSYLKFTNGVRFTQRGCWTTAQLIHDSLCLDVQVNMDSAKGKLLEKGDTFVLKNVSVYPLVKKGKEPSGFEQYLLRQGVQAKLYVNDDCFDQLNKNSNWQYMAYNSMHAKIVNSSLSPNSKSLLLSLLIGDRGYIDKATKDNFSALGVSHILSVSGLHVGIIYVILAFLIGLLWNKNAYIPLLVILLLIWFYCWMVGFEAAVLRSALMFSIHALGNALGKKSSLLHTTVLSAFIILLINPFFLHDIGFQLTYGAMMGIIFIMPIFQDVLKVKSAYLKPIIDLLLLSLAVQITLIPLLIFHFQTLPVYFMLANLLVVPAVALIMYAGMLFLLIPENEVLNFLLDLLVLINDSCCKMIGDWPYPMVYIVNDNLADFCFYSLCIANVVAYYGWKVNSFLWIAVLSFLAVFI
jgi:competence protein ComEC